MRRIRDPGAERLADGSARRRITEDHDTTLVVEAAAGTGKTTAVVRRVTELLARGTAQMDQIAAITFTEKAGGELRLRIREEIEQRIARERTSGEPAVIRRLEKALGRLEEAPIGTIHSFCATLLRERPIEAGVDPGFEILRGGEQEALFARAFRRFFSEQLDAPGKGIARLLRRVRGRESPVDRLREAGRMLLDYRPFDAPWTRRPWDAEKETRALVDQPLRWTDAEGNERRTPCLLDIPALYERLPEHGWAGNPNWLRESLAPAAELAREIGVRRRAGADDIGWAEQQLATLRVATYRGRDDPADPVAPRRAAFRDRLDDFQRRSNAELAADLREDLRPLLAAYGEAKRKAGKLDFDDLLLKTWDLLRANRDVRRELQNRFRQVLVDEFQDTDPIQTEIVLLLTALEEPPESDWARAVPVPGSLCLVGDPKQSIYAFRRADIAHYLRVKRRLLANGAAEVRLTTNFRSRPEICDFVNRVMQPVFEGHADAADGVSYVPLHPFHESLPGAPPLYGIPTPNATTQRELEHEEPQEVAKFVRRLLEDGHQVRSPATGRLRSVRESDICLLFRRFRSFGRLIPERYADALRQRGIACSLADVQSYIRSPEVTWLRAALTAIEFPRDEVSVYAALRSPLFSIPDEQLFRFRVGPDGGSRRPLQPGRPSRRGTREGAPPEEREVEAALDFLFQLHERRNARPIAVTVQDLLGVHRGETVFGFARSPAQTLSNLRRLTDDARAFEAGGGLSFRAFVERLADQAENPDPGGRNIVDEDVEAVRALTIHTAKGLEFPVVVLCDAAYSPSAPASRIVDPERRLYGCNLGTLRNPIRPWDLLEHEDEVMGKERRELDRLLYVAATRARDLLAAPTPQLRYGGGGLLEPVSKALEKHPCPPSASGESLPGARRRDAPEWRILIAKQDDAARRRGIRVEAEFLERRSAARAEASRETRRSCPAKALAEALAAAGSQPAGPVEVHAIAQDAGRPGGAPFGSVVHRILERVPFDADPAAVAREAERVVRQDGLPEELAASAASAVSRGLGHELIRKARAAATVYRELPLVLEAEVPGPGSGDGGPGSADPDEFASALDPRSSEDPNAASDEGGAPTPEGGPVPHPGPVLAPGPILVEGVADLAFQSAPGGAWTVVDFKTDTLEDDRPGSEERGAVYRHQVALYAAAVSRATGLPAVPALLFV